MSTLQRHLRHPLAAVTGDTAPFDTNQPLGAGRVSVMAANVQHLCEVNPLRNLAQNEGMAIFYADANTAGFTSAPRPGDIRWDLGEKDGALAMCLGTHFAWPWVGGRLPKLTVRFKVSVAATYTAGIVLVVATGRLGAPETSRHYASDTYTNASPAAESLSLDLTPENLERWPIAPRGGTSTAAPTHSGELRVFTAYLGGYCSSNGAGNPASCTGISLFLEPPS